MPGIRRILIKSQPGTAMEKEEYMTRRNKGNKRETVYTERDYSYNSRSRSREATRSFVFLDGVNQKGLGKTAGTIAGGIIFLALLAGVAWMILAMMK